MGSFEVLKLLSFFELCEEVDSGLSPWQRFLYGMILLRRGHMVAFGDIFACQNYKDCFHFFVVVGQ